MQTDYDFYNDELKIVNTTAYSDGDKATVLCYGANDVLEGVAIMKHESVDVFNRQLNKSDAFPASCCGHI